MKRLLLLPVFFLAAAPAFAEKATIDWEWVNVRSGPDPSADRVGRLVEGAEADIVGAEDDWLQVSYPGGKGWISAKSVKASPSMPAPAEAESPSAAYAASTDSAPEAAATAAKLQTVEAQIDPTPDALPRKNALPSKQGYLSEYLDPESSPPPDSAGSALIRMFSGLFIVLGIMGGAVWLTRKFLWRRMPSDRRGRGIQVLASRSISARQGLLLVEVGGMVWLLAQGPDQISLVAEVKDPDALRRLNESYEFLDSPFEAELRGKLDLESSEIFPADASSENMDGGEANPTTEDRLAALRERRHRESA